VRAACAACLFGWTSLTNLWTGLTGGYVVLFMQAGLIGWANRSDRLQVGRTGWSSVL